MAYDALYNFSYETVTTAPSPGTSGTTIVIGTTNFAQFPNPSTAGSYNCVVWPAGTFPLASNAEIVRVVGKATVGTLYLSRAQESSTNRNVGTGDQFAMNVTSKTLTDIQNYAPQDGWYSAGETWTYASGSTFTVSGDQTSKYTKSTKLKWTQGTVLYGVVLTSTYGAPNTTVTVIPNTDYPIGTAAITSPFYSYFNEPAAFPGWFSYTPVFSGFSGTPTSIASKYRADGKTITWILSTAAGTSNATTFTISTPVPSAHGNSINTPFGFAEDNGTGIPYPGRVNLEDAGTFVTLFSNLYTGAWTASGNKRVHLTITYGY